MQVTRKAAAQRTAFGTGKPIAAIRRAPVSVRAQAEPSKQDGALDMTRRQLLAGVALSPLIIVKGAEAASNIKYLEVDNLSSFQRADQRTEFRLRAEKVLKEILTAEDAPLAVRLALHDAGTFDLASKKGGLDGSIILNPEELERPENASLKGIAEKIKAAKAKIDEGDNTGAGPISYADTIFLAGKVAMQKQWVAVKIGDPATNPNGKLIASAFPNPWPVELGRIDSAEPGPNRVPAPDADVATIRQFLSKLGAKPGAGENILSPKPPFWERPGFLLWTASADDVEAEGKRFVAADPVYEGIKRNYDNSKETVTRTDYEVDFAAVYNKLCSQGAKFNTNAYLYKVPVQAIV